MKDIISNYGGTIWLYLRPPAHRSIKRTDDGIRVNVRPRVQEIHDILNLKSEQDVIVKVVHPYLTQACGIPPSCIRYQRSIRRKLRPDATIKQARLIVEAKAMKKGWMDAWGNNIQPYLDYSLERYDYVYFENRQTPMFFQHTPGEGDILPDWKEMEQQKFMAAMQAIFSRAE